MWHKPFMRYCVLGSGSNGNSCVVKHESAVILVDAGLGPLVLKKRLGSMGISLQEITHVLLTHEHWDHTRGLKGLCKRCPGIVVGGTRGTLSRLDPEIEAERSVLSPKRAFSIHGITVHSFSTSHDSADSLAFRIESPGGVLGLATDLGTYDDSIVEALKGANGLVLEANHCSRMLDIGPYPAFLKRRVAGEAGHLSNAQCRNLLEHILPSNPAVSVTFAHISAVNNAAHNLWKTLSPLFPDAKKPANWNLGDRRKALAPVDCTTQLSFKGF